MITLGFFDKGIKDSILEAYKKVVKELTRLSINNIKEGTDKLKFMEFNPTKTGEMTVVEMQQALSDAGFYSSEIDGLCGYRTLSSIRLFQEHIRTMENKPDFTPDGLFGPKTQRALTEWLDAGKQPDWQQTIDAWSNGDVQGTEFAEWLQLLEDVKTKYQANPTSMLEMVNQYQRESDTYKVSNWTVNPNDIHLIGVRRNEVSGKFDDIFILLIKGLVFKFQGTTEPGYSNHPRGTPFLVQGQHDYHFGWHQSKYLALRPLGLGKNGVLIVRSKDNKRLDEHDLKNGLEANSTINIHWGGKGLKFDVKKWSAGCQVITGSMYQNHNNELINCSSFVAKNNSHVSSTKTRGAYNVLLDLVTVLSSDMDNNNTVKFMLLNDEDLDLGSNLKRVLDGVRNQLVSQLDK